MFTPKYKNQNNEFFTFGACVKALANACLNNEHIKSFWNGFCCQSGDIEITDTEETIFSVGQAQKPTLDGNQYAVNIEKTGLCIVGENQKGLINGFMTLLHLIETRKITDEESVFEIKCGVFKEKPNFENIMIHFCVFPETELWELERFIRFCAAMKYSHIVIEFWGMLRYDCLKELGWSNAYTKEQIRPLIKMANELGIEIIPMFNHWGHAPASRALNGKHVVLDQNPRLQPLFSDDGWTWNIQNPETLKLLKNIRKELIELCGEGEYFHLGCDEAYNFEITIENHNVLTDYLNGISDELAACGRRAIMWGDMLIAKHDSFNPNNHYITSCASVELEQSLLSDLSRDIVIADWQYCVKEAPVETAFVFKNAGFDTLLCPWDKTFGDHPVAPCETTATDSDLFGIMHTTWHTLSVGMSNVTEAAWGAWNKYDAKKYPVYTYFVTNTAKILRKVFPVHGDYEKAGWAKKQMAEFIK